MPKLHINKNEKETCLAFAEWLADIITTTLQTKPRFNLAWCQSDVPKLIYKILATDFTERIDWTKVYFYPANAIILTSDNYDTNDNFHTFLQQLNLKEDQFYKLPIQSSAEEVAKEYEKVLDKDLGDQGFDFVLVSLAEDGTTLYISPGNEDSQTSNWITAISDEANSQGKISLTPAAINASTAKAFLVTGKKKEDVVQQVLKGKYNPERYPAQLIQATNKNLNWFLDEAAAGKIIKINP